MRVSAAALARRRRFGGGVVYDIYVDSANGNDANSGTSPAQAFATISAAETAALSFGNNVRIGLAYGSTWREMLDLSTLTGCVVHAYGNRSLPLPCLNASDVADPGDFSLAPSQSNTYLITWTHEIDSDYTKAKISVWEDGVRLKWVSSIANCEAEAGTFFVATGSVANPASVYVHPTGSTNPTSDGKTYEISARNYGLSVGGGYDVRYIHTTKQGHHNGSFFGGTNTLGYAKGLLGTHGVVHNLGFATAGGTYENCVAYRCEPSTWRSTSATLFIAYTVGNGAGATFNDCYSYSDAPAGNAHTNFYSHTSGGTNDLVSYNRCYAYGPASNFNALNLTALAVTDCFIESTGTAIDNNHVGASGASSVTVDNLTALKVRRLFQFADNLTARDVRAYMNGTVSGGLFYTTGLDIQNCTFVYDAAVTEANSRLCNSTAGMDVFQNNVVQNCSFRTLIGTTGIDSDYNVIRSPADATKVYYQFSGVAYNWANWLTQSGGDTNSVLQVSNATSICTDPANNDFSLTTSVVDEGGRTAGSRKHIATPDWSTLTAAWDAGYLGIDGTGP